MKKRNKNRIRALLLAGCMGLLAGCAGKATEVLEQPGEAVTAEAAVEEKEPEQGGTLVLKVNPEIAVEYDQNGKVTAVQGRNEDGRKIVKDDQEYVGRECHEVVEDLVRVIHEAGYFVEEVEGVGKKITIEIETGSVVPEEGFLDEIVTGVQTYVKDMKMESAVVTDPGNPGPAKEVDIYDSDYSERSYEVVVPPSGDQPGTGADATAQPPGASDAPDPSSQSSAASGGSDAPSQPSTAPSQPSASHDSPYTDYDTPYTDYDTPYTEPKADSPYTNYDTPYTEPKADSPYTDYETPYTEPKAESPYTDYEDSHYEDTSYSHYEEHSSYSDYD